MLMRASRSEFVDLPALRLHVRHWGADAAPPLFLLHGWMDVSASFQFLADELADRWHLIAPDWRGFGLSDWLRRPYWFPDYLADLEALLDRYAPAQAATLIGHSMGGIVACLYAGVRPQRIARVVTVEGFGVAATHPDMAPGRLDKWLRQAHAPPAMHRYASRAAFAERLRRDNSRLTAGAAEFLAEHLCQTTTAGDFIWAGDPFHRVVNPVLYRLEEAMACWRRISAPVLWVAAGDSDYVRQFVPDSADQAARKAAFADLREAIVADAGHMIHHDQPRVLAGLIEDFLRVTAT